MKICTKCKIEKEESCYYSYFHSVQQKTRTRNICNECFNIRKNAYNKKVRRKEIIPTKRIFKPKPMIEQVVLSDITKNPNFKQCRKCQEYLPLDKFYPAQLSFSASCKSCQYEQNVKRKLLKREQGYSYDTKKPNSYTNEEQKIDVFMIMEAMGWTFNDNNVWSKPGIKDKDKVWTNIKKREKKKNNKL